MTARIITSNLLAERPYKKYASNADNQTIDFEIRAEKFTSLIRNLIPDIIFLQEVDSNWESILNNNLNDLGYTFLFGDSWSSQLVIGVNKNFEFLTSESTFNHVGAGVLSKQIKNNTTNKILNLINIHAPWGSAHDFHNIYFSQLDTLSPTIIGGDFNTDKLEGDQNPNKNLDYFCKELLNPNFLWQEITSAIGFTARNVRNNKPEKLDYLFGRHISVLNTNMYPTDLTYLIPHCYAPEFDIKNSNNHFSDHALIFSDILV